MRKSFRLGVILATLSVSIAAAPSGVRAEDSDASRPQLSDLMVLTQLRHFKLWYAHTLNNWKLANYELEQLETTLGRIVKLYPTASSVAQGDFVREKTEPAVAELRRAISAKNGGSFEAAYKQITNACNECHENAGVGFIAVQVPTRSPFSNQNFSPVR